MKRIQPLQTCSYEQLSQQLGHAAGAMKTMVGLPDVVALFYLQDTLHKLSASPLYRGRVKQMANRVAKMKREWEQRLLHPQPSELRFFDVTLFGKDDKSCFHDDMTQAEYFEYWQCTGGELYADALPLMNALGYKFRRHFERCGAPDAKLFARLTVTANVLTIVTEAFNNVTRDIEKSMVRTTPSLTEITHCFSLGSIAKVFLDLCTLIIPATYKVTPEEQHDMELATNAIIDVLTDPVRMVECQKRVNNDYGTEVLRSKSVLKERNKEAAAMKRDIMRDVIAKRREKLLAK